MSNLRLATMRSFAEADEFLGQRNTKKVGHNTTARRIFLPSDTVDREYDIAVRYHQTDIVTYHADGSITLDTGGWATATTTNRMHMLTPAHIRVSHRFKKKPTREDWMVVTDVIRDAVTTDFLRLTIRPLINA